MLLLPIIVDVAEILVLHSTSVVAKGDSWPGAQQRTGLARAPWLKETVTNRYTLNLRAAIHSKRLAPGLRILERQCLPKPCNSKMLR